MRFFNGIILGIELEIWPVHFVCNVYMSSKWQLSECAPLYSIKYWTLLECCHFSMLKNFVLLECLREERCENYYIAHKSQEIKKTRNPGPKINSANSN